MKAIDIIQSLMNVVCEEVKRNPAFSDRLEQALTAQRLDVNAQRKGRRNSAVINPIEVIRTDEELLKRQLQELDIEQLKDIVSDYGMDTGKTVMRWKTPQKIIDHIIEMATHRSKKGDAFRS